MKDSVTTDAEWIKTSAIEIVRYVSVQAFGSSNLVNTKMARDIIIPRIENVLLDAWSKGHENAKR